MTTQTIVIDRLLVIKRLREVLETKQKEYDEWETGRKTYKKRKEAWDKKALAYILKNGESDDSSVGSYGRTYSVRIEIDKDELTKAVGKEPDNDCEPDFFRSRWVRDQQIAPVDEVKNALALYELSTEPTVKVSTKASWASYLT